MDPSLQLSPVTTPQFYRMILPRICISFGSPEGKLIFKEALQNGHMEGYFGLAAQFRTQDELAFCGLSTLVMVLNTLEVDPKRVWKGPWRWYDENMLDCWVPLDIAAKNGVTLDELACLASCNTLNVRMVHVDKTVPEESFRKVVKELTQHDDEFLVLSYSRGVLGQTGDGHFSPVAGYHEERDLVLILDTARFKYPPHWVPLPLLHKAMQIHDTDTGEARGYMRLRKSGQVPFVLFKVGESLSIFSVGGHPKDLTRRKTLDSFLDSWNAWLVAIGHRKDDPNQNVLESAAGAMIKCLQNLKKEDSILTTQMDLLDPHGLSATHECVIQELLTSLESLPLYAVVEKAVAQSKQMDCLHTEIGQYEDNSNYCWKRAKLSDSGQREKENSYDNMFGIKLLPAHFVTMLICARPALGNTCSLLKKLVRAQLYKSSTVLQDEVAQLSRQLQSILDFKQCCMFESKC